MTPAPSQLRARQPAEPRSDRPVAVAPDRRRRPEVVVVVLAFEAESTIDEVLDRIPDELRPGARPFILVADDASGDDTARRAHRWSGRRDGSAEVVVRARNLGYGGNQRASYAWAIERGMDVAVLLHGDAQYPPELIGDLIAPILDGRADVVFGSRMAVPGAARRGGMPISRRVGNRLLSTMQNRLAGTDFTEWHSGFRAYRLDVLADLDLEALPSGFDFDTALMLELLDRGRRVEEFPIPTRYADEKSRVQLVRFGLRVIRLAVGHRWRRRTVR